MKFHAAIGALCLLLGGCAAGTDYRSPELAMPSSFRSVPIGTLKSDRAWWQSYNDPVLDRIVVRALSGNLDIEIALARVDRASAVAGAAKAAQLPSISVDGGATRTRQSMRSGTGVLSGYVPDFARTQNTFELTTGASWELDLAGGLRRGREAARAELQAAVADTAAVRVTVVAETADAYFQLRSLQEGLAIAHEQASLAERLEALVQHRLTVGGASKRELDQAIAATASQRAALVPIEADIQHQLIRLSILAGEMPEADRAGLETPAPLPEPRFADIGEPSALLRRRPDLVAAERRLAASHARIGVALAEYYPRFSLSALFGGQSNRLGNLFSGPANVIQGGVGLRWRLFDFGRIEAEVADARGAKREALAAFRNSVLLSAEDVERAVVAWETARARIDLHRDEVIAATAAKSSVLRAFEAGHVSLVEVTDADRRLLTARNAFAKAKADAARASVAAWRALGI